MAPPIIYVAIWGLAGGKTLPTLTTEATYKKWREDPERYATKRIRRWNSPNRRNAKLSKALSFQVVCYARLNYSSGSVQRVAS